MDPRKAGAAHAGAGGRMLPSNLRGAIESIGAAGLLAAAAACTLAFWAYCVVQRAITGPLNVDEIYFSHMLWLVGQGKRMYVDFYSNHLPVYFLLLKPLVSALSHGPADLGFVWAVRGLSAVILLAYLLLGWWLHRMLRTREHFGFLAVGSLLLLFAVNARFLEVRADTIGLILMNTAWAVALSGVSRPRLLLTAVLAGMSVWFSGRAGLMALVAGGCLLFLAFRNRDARAIGQLCMAAAGFAAVLVALYVYDPTWMTLMVQSAVVDPSRFTVRVDFWRRVLPLDRACLLAFTFLALFSGLRMLGSGQVERGTVVAGACAGQLMLILIDPAPYQYVYGWATIPVVFGVVSFSPRLATVLAGGVAVLYAPAVFAFVQASPFAPPLGSVLRPFSSPVLSREEVKGLPTPKLVQMMLTGERQRNLQSQLRVREEVCRRTNGTVMAPWSVHPVCLPDANYHWSGLRWPLVAQSAAGADFAWTMDEFLRIITTTRPALFVWRPRPDQLPKLPRALEEPLSSCYDQFDGFALPNSHQCLNPKPEQLPDASRPS